METVTLRQIMTFSLGPNWILVVYLAWIWGKGELFVHDVWRNMAALPLAFLYLVLIVILYFAALFWICFVVNKLADSFGWARRLFRATNERPYATPSWRISVFWVASLVAGAMMAVPFVMTRAHSVHSTIMWAGELGYWLGALLVTVSAYTLIWNVAEKIF